MQRFIFVGHNVNIFRDADDTVLISDKKLNIEMSLQKFPNQK